MKIHSGIKLSELNELINGKVIGNADGLVTGINEIHRVEVGDLTFVDHPKYYDKALNSAASFILINKEVVAPAGKGLIFTDDPFRDYVYLTRRFMPFVPSASAIDPSATIGKGTILQPNVAIGPEVVIGKNCIIHSGVVIYDHSVIGDNVILHANTVIGSDAFYFKRRPEFYEKMHSCGRVVIHDHVEIGACCTIDRGVSSDTIIGKGTKLDNHVHVGHDTVIGKNCLFAAHVGIAGCVNIEDEVIFWGQVGCQKDLTVGKGAIVYGQSGISKSLKGGLVYFGSPAKEAREKMKEMALVSRLPELFSKIK
ncbi:MAG: UDP-3-O-(3-hydroxymyristoyl)glucosamine N-acyltransferase [Bacteroidetes bacterium]|nr:UDP-3-O-(3-hydroxymyristoyl)glucosamine N-acyltransferase [Bacteroidota bacterium]MBL0096852.1 UDP-3-O-(3-hydroxymyristoyl)glucosamine N-acyltransferase [Bacteroidota bacterium]